MSRDYRDKPGGHAPGKWYLANGSRWVQFMKRQCRRNVRAKLRTHSGTIWNHSPDTPSNEHTSTNHRVTGRHQGFKPPARTTRR